MIPCGLGFWFHVGNICQRECVGKGNDTLIVSKINGSICFVHWMKFWERGNEKR